jgi:hypothetical protein
MRKPYMVIGNYCRERYNKATNTPARLFWLECMFRSIELHSVADSGEFSTRH